MFGNKGRVMGVIKDLLREELANSVRLKKEYAAALQKQPGGSIIKKQIRGNAYYYLAFREGRKVRFLYKGKAIAEEDRRKLRESKRLRLKYRELIKKLGKRIKYLKRALHGKEE